MDAWRSPVRSDPEGEMPGARARGRRTFLQAGLSCASWLAIAGTLAPAAVGRAFRRDGSPRSRIEAPWGRLDAVGDGIWALVSTPLAEGLHARRTLCNGGIIAGRQGVLVVEAFATAEGARWMADQARRLTGKRVTHVVITHHHGDHSGGRGGYADRPEPPRVMTTRVTRKRLAEKAGQEPPDAGPAPPLPEASVPAEGDPAEVDLGDRIVRIVPRRGHTASDLTVRVQDPPVLFCGDLVWNGLFPNYMDARPSELHAHVRDLVEADFPLYVPGHGGLADRPALRTYFRLLEEVEDAARRAFREGVPPERAATDFRAPETLGEWNLFSDRYYAVAFKAWARELEAGS